MQIHELITIIYNIIMFIIGSVCTMQLIVLCPKGNAIGALGRLGGYAISLSNTIQSK